MLKHIIMFKIKESYPVSEKEAIINELSEALYALPDKIPEIVRYEIGINISKSANAYDLLLDSEFEDEDSLEIYRVHPAHQKVLKLIKELTEDIKVVDYYL